MRMNQGRVRITVSVTPEVARQLDEQRSHRGLNRSEAVSEAVTDWVKRWIEGDEERITGRSRELERQRKALDDRIRLSSQEIIEALRHQFSSIADFEDSELERRALAALARRRQRERSSGTDHTPVTRRNPR